MIRIVYWFAMLLLAFVCLDKHFNLTELWKKYANQEEENTEVIPELVQPINVEEAEQE